MIVLVVSLGKLWIMFLYVVSTLVFVVSGLSDLINTRSSVLLQFLIYPICCMGMPGFV